MPPPIPEGMTWAEWQRVQNDPAGAAETVGGREQGIEGMMGGGEGGRVPVGLENEGAANAGV